MLNKIANCFSLLWAIILGLCQQIIDISNSYVFNVISAKVMEGKEPSKEKN
jgi:hypothetical protein